MNENYEQRIKEIEKDNKIVFGLIILLSIALIIMTLWIASTQIQITDSKNNTIYSSKTNKTIKINVTFERKSLESVSIKEG